MIFYRLVFHSKPLGPIISELYALLSLALSCVSQRPLKTLASSQDPLGRLAVAEMYITFLVQQSLEVCQFCSYCVVIFL